MGYFERSFQRVSRVLDNIGSVTVVALAVLICGNIVGRLFKQPILGTYDIAGFMGAVLFSFALAYCALQGGHVAVGIVVDRLSQRTQAIVGIVTGIISTGFFAMAAWQCGVYGTDLWHHGTLSQTTKTPLHPFVYAVAFGCLMLFLALLVDVFKSVAKVVKK